MKKIALCSLIAVVAVGVNTNSFAYVTPGMEIVPYVAPATGTAAAVLPVITPIAIAAATVVATGAVVAVANSASNWHSDCSVGSLTYESRAGFSLQKPADDEYLYVSKSDYKTAKKEFEKHANSGNGKGFECDTAGSRHCKKNDVVSMKAGHVFRGNVINKAHKYKCQVNIVGNDYWEDLGEISEQKPEEKACSINGQTVRVGDHLHVNCNESGNADIRTGEKCRVYCLKKNNTLYSVYGIVTCPKNYSPVNRLSFSGFSPSITDILYGRCDKQQPKPNSCKESRKTEEGKACCDFSAKIADWDSKTQHCICAAENASFEKVNGKWQCVPKAGTCDSLKGNLEAYACCTAGYKWENGRCEGCPDGQSWYWDAAQGKGMCIDNGSVVNPGSTTTCTETDCKITITQSIKCRYNDNHFTSTQTYPICEEDLKKQNLNRTQCQDFQKLVNTCQNLDCIANLLAQVNAYNQVIAKVCNQFGAPTPVVVPDNSAKIAAAKQTVSSFFGSAESNKSVWKDAQGNFNTARLASDLTAGVVLGTVGGVVSGVVIKKKQIEKGFDALHCAVGGQTVADWGDTFNVGLRR